MPSMTVGGSLPALAVKMLKYAINFWMLPIGPLKILVNSVVSYIPFSCGILSLFKILADSRLIEPRLSAMTMRPVSSTRGSALFR